MNIYQVICYPAGAGPWGESYTECTTFDHKEAEVAIKEAGDDFNHLATVELPKQFVNDLRKLVENSPRSAAARRMKQLLRQPPPPEDF